MKARVPKPRGKHAPHHDLSPEEQRHRKQRVLTKGTSSIVGSIADAVVVKDDNLFFLTPPNGEVPLTQQHGFGLYYRDCRYLNGYEMTLEGAHAEVLAATAEWGYRAIFQLTNPDLQPSKCKLIHKEHVGIKWERLVDVKKRSLHDGITFQNFGHDPVEFVVSLTFRAAFEDVFAIRGMLPETLGTLRRPGWKYNCLYFVYDGADRLHRSLSIHFSSKPDKVQGTTARFRMALQPEESRQITVSLAIAESERVKDVRPRKHDHPDLKSVEHALHRSADQWLSHQTEIRTDSILLNRVVHQSLLDLHVLKSKAKRHAFFAAGVPWFVALIGRDSLIASLQTLAYDSGIAEQTLRVLADYQGQKIDEFRDEQPGKILHELRVGEMARLNEIPQSRYYGSIDATLLFLILLGCHAAWTGTLAVFNDLRSHVERALEWIGRYGDKNGDGYIEYQSSSEKGLVNQGWKDSGDAIVNVDGTFAKPPISLVEVQGYAYMAKNTIAELYRRAGETDRADRLQREAGQLRARFNRDFWMEDKAFYALALEADRKPCAVISSNPGQALWTGIVDADNAKRTVKRLMAPDMFSGWGIRTLSYHERRYNPIGYHLGTVWPHDNSLIGAGLRRYGFDEEVGRIFQGMVEAAMHFEHDRLPEVFAGFSRDEYRIPVRYPVACHPQAWAAGSIPYLIESCLGLQPEAFDGRLRIVRPILPSFITYLEISRLRVGDAKADLRFERKPDGKVAAEVLKVDGPLDVVIEP